MKARAIFRDDFEGEAADGYARMMQGKARFRMVLVNG